MFIAELFIITKPKCPLADKWIKQLWDNGILLGRKKEENVTLCNSMDGPGEHYAK